MLLVFSFVSECHMLQSGRRLKLLGRNIEWEPVVWCWSILTGLLHFTPGWTVFRLAPCTNTHPPFMACVKPECTSVVCVFRVSTDVHGGGLEVPVPGATSDEMIGIQNLLRISHNWLQFMDDKLLCSLRDIKCIFKQENKKRAGPQCGDKTSVVGAYFMSPGAKHKHHQSYMCKVKSY